jgi:asparagine synthase (glutamine-hydrolysing)
MCGIVGAFGTTSEADEQWLAGNAKTMLSRVSHRGYWTDRGFVFNDRYALGCVRLPIVDASHGVQPIESETGRITVVLNGEIYNYRQLKKRHLAGTHLKTNSDTEVLANLLEKCGIEQTLPQLEGMFAFMAYDKERDKFYLARDLIGIKPLYFVKCIQGVLAASELKAFDHDAWTITELPPQHYYDSEKGLSLWEPRKHLSGAPLGQLIANSVREQVQTKLPVAVLLSGGIDSSVICYEANQFNSNVTAFAIGKPDSNDMLAAQRFCVDLGFKFEPIIIGDDEPLLAIEDTVRSIESFEPNHIRAGTLSYLISKHITSKGYRISLCGEGADELFAGYPDFIALLQRTGNDYHALENVLESFMDGLYLTQLKRVDRTGMRFALEVRPPFLCTSIIERAKRIPAQEKITLENGAYITKKPLREAYRGILPDYIVDRIKSVFSEGAGYDTNGHHGPFWDYTSKLISAEEVAELQKGYPQCLLTTHEEAYYFKLYLKYFDVEQVRPQRLFMSAL